MSIEALPTPPEFDPDIQPLVDRALNRLVEEVLVIFGTTGYLPASIQSSIVIDAEKHMHHIRYWADNIPPDDHINALALPMLANAASLHASRTGKLLRPELTFDSRSEIPIIARMVEWEG